jgi:hypothetical protein
VWDVAGAGLLRVVPDGQECRPGGIGALDRSDEGRELGYAQTVLRDGLRVTNSDVPPPRASHPLEYTQLEREARDGDVVLVVWLLHGSNPTYGRARRTA